METPNKSLVVMQAIYNRDIAEAKARLLHEVISYLSNIDDEHISCVYFYLKSLRKRYFEEIRARDYAQSFMNMHNIEP